MDGFRKVFDLIPDAFDKWRPRYCQDAFDGIIHFAGLRPSKKVPEIGSGTGQATEPLLKSRCDYLGIEQGSTCASLLEVNFRAIPTADS